MPDAIINGGEVIPFKRRKRPLTGPRALALIRSKEIVEVPSVSALGDLLGWQRTRTGKALKRWERAGQIAVSRHGDGSLTIRALSVEGIRLREFGPGDNRDKPGRRKRSSRQRKRAEPRVRARQQRDEEREIVDPEEREIEAALTRENTSRDEREKEREIRLENRGTPKGYENKPTPGNVPETAPEYLHGTAPESAPVVAGNTSTPTTSEQASPEAVEHVPAATYGEDHSPVRHAERPVWRRQGGNVTGGGGGGFDAVEAFGRASWAERLLIVIAFGLSATAAVISVTGMTVLFPAGAMMIIVLGSLIEAGKFVGFGVISAGWRTYSFLSKWFVAVLLITAALINAAAVYGWLIASHAGPAAGRSATFTERDADQGARLEVANGKLSDIDRRIALIDSAAEGAAKRGRSRSAISAIEAQRKQRASLVSERTGAATEVANLRAGRTGIQARRQEDEAATTPIRYAALLFEDAGIIQPGTDPEKLVRWLAFMILMCGDPLALGCLFMINSRARRAA